ncbi:MAG TPA: protein-disulfide reductase DsbD domain-containing protein [Chitinophagaceae bacterium]
MKRFLSVLMLLMIGTAAFSQVKDPVSWSFSAKKKSANTFDIIITATMAKPWHIYSTKSPEGAGLPTQIKFRKNPLVSLSGAVKENGKLESQYDENFEVEVKYYSNKVEFIQTVVLRGNAKTNVSGTVEYMVCDDERCLPPATKSFDIKL